jgi:hypothetical protein
MEGAMDRFGARVTSWFIAIAVAFFPAIVSAASRLSPNLFAMAEAANAKAHFHDFYFGAMVISAFSLSNLWDSFAGWETVPTAEDKKLSRLLAKLWKPVARLIYAFFFIVVFYGGWEYFSIRETIVSAEELNRCVWLLIIVLVVSLGTEAMIAFAEVRRESQLWGLLKGSQLNDLIKREP